ncbi:MAG: hypothetical protein CMM75_10125 [Rhodospirillaceae bacterium]|nr:hypothetical protein [Rhodospirillaceae bacterium]
MNTKICTFTAEGKDQFRELLDEMRLETNSSRSYADFWGKFESTWHNLLTNRNLSIPWGEEGSIDISNSGRYDTKYAIAEYLYSKLGSLWRNDRALISGNEELWSWISCFFLETLSATNSNRNIAKIHARHYYYYSVNDLNARGFPNEYRNIISSAFTIFAHHEGTAGKSLLNTPIYSLGDGCDHVLSEHGFITSKPILEVIDHLCPEDKDQNMRRLSAILNQFRLVYDLYEMTAEQILEKLKRIPEYKPLID